MENIHCHEDGILDLQSVKRTEKKDEPFYTVHWLLVGHKVKDACSKRVALEVLE